MPWSVAVVLSVVALVALVAWLRARGRADALLAAEARLTAELAAAQAASGEVRQRLGACEAELAGLRQAERSVAAEAERLRGELARVQAVAEERQRGQEEARATLGVQLRSLAQQLYEEQGKAVMGEGRQALEATLAPFRERLQELRARIDQVHADEVRERASLGANLQSMLTAQARLHDEAAQLGRALRSDTQVQGSWGEITLQRLLESSQLVEGITYELQVGVSSDEGRAGRPDAVVFLPDRKALAIDAKVSLTAFLRAQQAGDATARALALQEHLLSVRTHLKQLAARDYPESLRESLKGRALDLTLLFMPSEPAFAAALAQDGELWAEAQRQRVVIVSPTTLLATLRVVAHIWRVEQQNRNAAAIAKEAGGILEKLRGALDDLDGVGRALAQAQASYDQARARLSTGKGNLLARAGKLMRLGAPAKDGTRARLAGADEAEDDSEEPG